MEKAPSKKTKIFCCIMVITFSVICILIGFVELSVYTKLKDKCSSEVTGTVVYEGTGRIDDTDKAEKKKADAGREEKQVKMALLGEKRK